MERHRVIFKLICCIVVTVICSIYMVKALVEPE